VVVLLKRTTGARCAILSEESFTGNNSRLAWRWQTFQIVSRGLTLTIWASRNIQSKNGMAQKELTQQPLRKIFFEFNGKLCRL
jgi:hypothetical protein